MKIWSKAFLLLLLIPGWVLGSAGWKNARSDYSWSFPADHWARPGYRLEWWYFTGHLETVNHPQRRFSYQFTFFRIGLLPEPPESRSRWTAGNLILGHASVGDLLNGRHRFSELLYREIPLLGGFPSFPDPILAWSRAPAGTDDEWRLSWNGDRFAVSMRDDRQGFSFDLSTRPVKPLVLQGPGGYSRKGDDAGSQYYSFTRLATKGELSVDGETFRVEGESWMDKEFGSGSLGEDQVGWDWFGLQLDDGREIMLYLMRDPDGRIAYARGTRVSAAGEPAYLSPTAWQLRATDTWKSPETGARYPARWSLEIPGENLMLEINPEIADQENRSRITEGLYYWEGAVAISDPAGKRVGRGFVELTGYGDGGRPPYMTPHKRRNGK